MSQKAICPRGHIWDPSMLAGLPPTDTPRCPICGEEEPLRASNALARLNRWCRNNPTLAGLSTLCLFLGAALTVTILLSWNRIQREHAEVEKAQFEAQQAEAKYHSPIRAAQAENKDLQRGREAEMQAAKWRDRETEFEKQLRDVKENAKTAREQRDEQIHLRKLADELKQTAEQERQDERSRRAEALRKLVKMYVADGIRLMEIGDLSASLPCFVEALRLAEK